MSLFVEVSHEQFYKFMGQLDVHPSIVGGYPYETSWKLRTGECVGKTVPVTRDSAKYSSLNCEDKYYIKANENYEPL